MSRWRPIPKTKQGVFNRVLRGIREQGGSAYDYRVMVCKYRTPEGRKCAAGLLIPDSKYTPYLEGSGVSTNPDVATPINNALRDAGLSRDHFALVSDLQRIHDGIAARAVVHYRGDDSAFMERYERGMRDYAERHGLRYPEPV